MFIEIGRDANIDVEFIHTTQEYAEQLFRDSRVDVLLFANTLFQGEIKNNEGFKTGKVEIGQIKPALFSYKNRGIGIKDLRMSEDNWPLVFGSKKVVLAPFDGFDHWITSISKQLGSSEDEFNFRKTLIELQYGVKDLILHDANVFHYQLSKLPFDYGVTEVGQIVSNETDSSIFALTNETLTSGDSIAAILSRGLIHLRRQGKLRSVLSRYKVADWKNSSNRKHAIYLSH